MTGLPVGMIGQQVAVRKNLIKIGRPGYKITKLRDPVTRQLGLLFQLQYPEIGTEIYPRHRFMSAFEQRVEQPPDRAFQYLLVAAEPYETCAFKLQAKEVDKSPGKFWTHYDPDTKEYFLQLFFKTEREERCKFPLFEYLFRSNSNAIHIRCRCAWFGPLWSQKVDISGSSRHLASDTEICGNGKHDTGPTSIGGKGTLNHCTIVMNNLVIIMNLAGLALLIQLFQSASSDLWLKHDDAELINSSR